VRELGAEGRELPVLGDLHHVPQPEAFVRPARDPGLAQHDHQERRHDPGRDPSQQEQEGEREHCQQAAYQSAGGLTSPGRLSVEDAQGGAGHGQGGNDDLVARPHPGRRQGGVHRSRAIGGTDGELGVELLRESLLEPPTHSNSDGGSELVPEHLVDVGDFTFGYAHE